MRTAIVTLLLVGMFLPSPSIAQEKVPQEEWTALRALYKDRADLNKHRQAAAKAAELAGKFSDDREIQLFCSLTAYYCAHRLKDRKVKIQTARAGVECAKRVLAKDKSDYDGRYWWAMTYAKTQEAEGITKLLEKSKEVRTYLEKMISDQPKRYEAYMMLGALYRELPKIISWGDPAKSVEILEKAEALSPKDPEVLLELAAAYAAVGRKEEAAKTYDRCIGDSVVPKDKEWETQDARDYAIKMKKAL
jgi:tetratricopeptide (TPR) repeat protein